MNTMWTLTCALPLGPVGCHAGDVPGCGLQQLSQLSLHGCALLGLQQLQPGPRLRNLQLFRNTFTRCSMRQLVDNCPGLVEVRRKHRKSTAAAVHTRAHTGTWC